MRKGVLAVAIALTALLFVGAVPALAFNRGANEATLLRLVNHARTKRGLKGVEVVRSLHRAALRHSRDMIARDYFSHSSRSGASLAKRARRAGYSASGYSGWRVGEVMAWGKGIRGTPQAVFRSWMRSRAHRRIVLSKRWRDVGIGCSRGKFKGRSGVVMYTVEFGRRAE